MPTRIAGRNVLIVEDEYWIAEDMAVHVRKRGGVVLGPFADTDLRGVHLHQIDIAILDVNLAWEARVFPLAYQLRQACIPFIFVTGYELKSPSIPYDLHDVPLLTKPVKHLDEVILELLALEHSYYDGGMVA